MVLIEIYTQILPTLLQGAGVTLQITLISALFAFLFAFLTGFGRLSKIKPIRWLTAIVVEFLRGTSLLIQLFWLFYALPLLGIRFDPFVAGVLALALNYGAYGSEIVRSAIVAVPKGQTEAAIALNMTPARRMISVILPQAFRTMLPNFGNQLIELLKGTALVSLITIPELMFEAQAMRANIEAYTTQIFTSVLIIYFLIGYPLTMAVRWMERRFSLGGGH